MRREALGVRKSLRSHNALSLASAQSLKFLGHSIAPITKAPRPEAPCLQYRVHHTSSWPHASNCNLLPRLKHNCAKTMRFYTDYSGFECPRWGFSAMEKILRADTDNDEFDEPEPWAKFCRTCDYAEVPSQICCAIHEATGEGCHLSDIIARLHPTAQDWIKSAVPDEDDTPEVKAKAHDVIG